MHCLKLWPVGKRSVDRCLSVPPLSGTVKWSRPIFRLIYGPSQPNRKLGSGVFLLRQLITGVCSQKGTGAAVVHDVGGRSAPSGSLLVPCSPSHG